MPSTLQPGCSIFPCFTKIAYSGLLALIATVLPTAPATAQCPNYGISQATGGVINPGTTDTGNHCDDCVTPITFPFPVTFYSQTYTSANVSSNGNLQFNGEAGDFANICLPGTPLETALTGPSILAFWDDLRTDIIAGRGIFTGVSGVAPNRVFEIEWRARFFVTGAPVNFQIRFVENVPGFQIVYGAETNASSATIGTQPGSGGSSAVLTCGQSSLTLAAGTRLIFDCAATRFTYQGRLTENGAPATGTFPMRFDFYPASTGFSSLATVDVPAVQVDGGLFTVPLDVPGLPLDGRSVFIQASVNGVGLLPRQQMTSAPLSTFARTAGSASAADLATRTYGLSALGGPTNAVSVAQSGAVTIPGALSVGGALAAGSVTTTGAVSAGSLTTGSVALNPPVMRTITFGPADYQPVQSTMSYNRAFANGSGNAGLVGNSINTPYTFQAPVHLPQGATITIFAFSVYTSLSNQTFSVSLNATSLTGVVTPLSPRVIFAAQNVPQPTAFAVSIPVDNTSNIYSLQVSWSTTTPAQSSMLLGAYMQYTVNSPLP